jgi:hypothetical protein
MENNLIVRELLHQVVHLGLYSQLGQVTPN